MNFYKFSKTKIVATLGPACQDKETLVQMVTQGMDIARLNFSHGDHATHLENLNMIRGINKELGTNIAILQDLQGPKIRLGNLEGDFHVQTGDEVVIRTDIKEQIDNALPIQYETFAKDVEPGDHVLADDGKVEMTVLETNKINEVKLRVDFGDVLRSRKGVNLPQTRISIPTITEKDFRDIDFAIEQGVEWLALSFVRSADDIRILKELIRLRNGVSKIIAKIEKPEALEHIAEIIDAADAIMVARGDLGVEIPMEEVPAIQKRIIRMCNRAGKPVIVATQVMESMIENHRPTRAEASDVANAVVDGADAVMLSGETSVGKHPIQVISSMNRILMSVEKESEDIYYKNMELHEVTEHRESEAIIATACRLAKEAKASAIVGMTRSGYTAFQLSHCRPKSDLFIFTGNRLLLTTLNLVWGVRAFFYDGQEGTDESIQDVHEILKERGMVKSGDVIINTASMPLHRHGLTNMIKISRVKASRNTR